ncbi:hypothetical protein BD410DRAFT_316292 [Rickenella mellea]|uniref:Uncharacterized protein n=1 Tax=Rickenella mellea TaxID=50990 RepID=A0A4Y7Q2W9_9AGAM|nr:hypothetical protein BD410DRAFT_316292 [Rickenella mellea]
MALPPAHNLSNHSTGTHDCLRNVESSPDVHGPIDHSKYARLAAQCRCLFWLRWFEECHPEWMHWMFAEDKKEQVVPQRLPGFTAYRTLVMAAIASFGISKAVLASKGKSAEVNWMDLVLGVVCTSGLFWLGLYQRNCPGSWRGFFIKEYFSALSVVLAVICSVLLRIWPLIFFIFAIKHYIVDRWLEIPGTAPYFSFSFSSCRVSMS